MRHKKRGLALLLLLALPLLCGCEGMVSERPMEDLSGWVIEPGAQAPTQDAFDRQTQTVTLYLLSSDGERLVPVPAEVTLQDGESAAHAALTALDDARLVWVSLGQLLGGRVGVNDLSGPVGVASTMAVTARVNIRAFLQLVAFISINLGVMNLLPLPALDGGRLVFLIIEGIRRKPVPPKYEGLVHAAGLMLLLMLMVYVTGHDILRLLTGRMMQ